MRDKRTLRAAIACWLLALALLGAAESFGQAGGQLPWLNENMLNATGVLLPGGKLCSYAAGTTTPLATYGDKDLAGLNVNPLVMNSAGRPSVDIYLDAVSYKFALRTAGTDGTCSTGTVVWTRDNVYDKAALYRASFATKLDDKVCHASQYAGTTPNDEGGKIAACIAVLPSTGGSVDVRGLEGAQAWSSCWATGVTKPVILLMGVGTTTLSTDCTIPANVTISFQQGSVISNAASTLTYSGGLQAPLSQIFAGAGTFNLGSAKIPETYPEWFGAVGDGTTDDTTAVNLACASTPDTGAVAMRGGATYYFTGQLLIGKGLATACHTFMSHGRAVLKFNVAGHATDLIVMKGYNLGSGYYGIQYFPIVFSGFDVLAQSTGRDAVVLQESDHPVIENVRVLLPYRDGIVFTPSAGAWIENPFMHNVAVSKAGQHCFYFATINANTFINDGTYVDTECRGAAINSVALGINAAGQPTQLGACIYVISKGGATTGDVAGHTWIAHTCDIGSNFAVANGSAPNPDAVFFADGRNAQVIEGAGVAGSNRNFSQWKFINPRVEDVAAGGFTTGTCWTKESASVTTPNLWIESADGGNYCALINSPQADGDGNMVWSAVYPGGIRNLYWSGPANIRGDLTAGGVTNMKPTTGIFTCQASKTMSLAVVNTWYATPFSDVPGTLYVRDQTGAGTAQFAVDVYSPQSATIVNGINLLEIRVNGAAIELRVTGGAAPRSVAMCMVSPTYVP